MDTRASAPGGEVHGVTAPLPMPGAPGAKARGEAVDSRGDLEVTVSDQPGRGQLLCLFFLGGVVAVVAECRVGRFMGER